MTPRPALRGFFVIVQLTYLMTTDTITKEITTADGTFTVTGSRTMTKDQAAELVQEAITIDLLSEIDDAWNDHWNSILEHADGELVQAIKVLTGKSELYETDGTEFACNFKISVTVTPDN